MVADFNEAGKPLPTCLSLQSWKPLCSVAQCEEKLECILSTDLRRHCVSLTSCLRVVCTQPNWSSPDQQVTPWSAFFENCGGRQPGKCHSAHFSTLASICVDFGRIYCFPDWAETAETGLEGGRENGWIVDNFNPFLLFLDRLGSSKFVPNLRKNDVIDASCQHTASLYLMYYIHGPGS